MSERPSSFRPDRPARPVRDNPFETETMAELCVRQGHRDEGLAIYRRLLGRAADAAARERLGARVALLEVEPGLTGGPTPPPATGLPVGERLERGRPTPLMEAGLRATIAGAELLIDWRLPAEPHPREPQPRELEVLLVLRTATGVATETRSLRLEGETGRLTLHVEGLHSARAAAGYRRDNRFIPLLRAPQV